VALALDQGRRVSALEQASAAGIALVEALRVGAVEEVHARGELRTGALDERHPWRTAATFTRLSKSKRSSSWR